MDLIIFLKCAYTLIYLINAQDGISEQEGIFSKMINQAGWNKRAGGYFSRINNQSEWNILKP